jgi:hypothetical protein
MGDEGRLGALPGLGVDRDGTDEQRRTEAPDRRKDCLRPRHP